MRFPSVSKFVIDRLNNTHPTNVFWSVARVLDSCGMMKIGSLKHAVTTVNEPSTVLQTFEKLSANVSIQPKCPLGRHFSVAILRTLRSLFPQALPVFKPTLLWSDISEKVKFQSSAGFPSLKRKVFFKSEMERFIVNGITESEMFKILLDPFVVFTRTQAKDDGTFAIRPVFCPP